MLSSVKISGYRGFSTLEMHELRRVNLLVGRNNSGKTSVLEAIYLLAADGDPSALHRILSRRGERFEPDGTSRNFSETELDISHLFCGHEFRQGSVIHIEAQNGASDRGLSIKIQELTSEQLRAIGDFDDNNDGMISKRLGLHFTGSPKPVVNLIILSRQGGISTEALEPTRRLRGRRTTHSTSAQYVTTESLSAGDLAVMWNDIVLTESEDMVLSSLRILEPNIERIAAMAPSPYYFAGSRGGFKVKLKNSNTPVPIGSLGDGIWRMLAIAIAVIRAKNGFLLIDEVDTGLHYSVMTDIWNLIVKTSNLFDVQVFATTHSYDCIQSIAETCHEHATQQDDISIQKIEHGRPQAIPYSEAEIRVAAQRKIEIR